MTTIDDGFAAKKATLDELRPLSRTSYEALAAWYDVELTYTSNAIEGNTLTRSETAIVLEKGITVNGKPLRDHMEAVGHKDALDYVRGLARRDEPIREIDIRHIHALLLGRSDPENAGRYSTVQRMISGSPLVLPGPAEISPLMADFSSWLFNASPNAETAFTAHARLVAIHPFSDGNGRTARLLMNLILFKAGYPPVIIGPEERADYIASLEELQLRRGSDMYLRFMKRRLDASLDNYIGVLRQDSN